MATIAEPVPTPSSVAQRTIQVVYEPSAPLTSRFQFDTGIASEKNYVRVDTDTEIVLTLAPSSPGTFAETPVLWSVSPFGQSKPQPQRSDDGRTISFTMPPPASYFVPWMFRVSVDAELNGITSPLFLIVRDPSSPAKENCTLTYDPDDGSFRLADGLTLGNETGLFNAISPLEIEITLTGATFWPNPVTGSPIFWTAGAKPGWVSVSFDHATNSLTLNITGAGNGEIAGFQFIVEVDGIQLLSPDPVLINATLGDG